MSSKIFNSVILTYSDNLYRFALSILKEPEAAKDAMQDCLVKIWNKRNTLQKIDNPQAWAFRVTRNHCLDIIRSSRRTEILEDTLPLADNQSTDFDLLYSDQEKWLRKTLQCLPEKQQQVFHLREVEELSYQEICDILELNMSEVKVCLHRARKVIKSNLEKVEAYGV